MHDIILILINQIKMFIILILNLGSSGKGPCKNKSHAGLNFFSTWFSFSRILGGKDSIDDAGEMDSCLAACLCFPSVSC